MRGATERQPQEIRRLTLTRNYTKYAEGAVLIECGGTKVLCTATVTEGVPRFLKGQGQGWVTAEYAMLPRATHSRNVREATKGKQSGRTLEIQRLIARSLRAAIDLKKLGEFTVMLDCDVLQADGGTRTAAITGAFVALSDAVQKMIISGKLSINPIKGAVAAISVGIVHEQIICDLEYAEDVVAGTDMNVVMMEGGELIEVQGTAEGAPFTRKQLDGLLDCANAGLIAIFKEQKKLLDDASLRSTC